MNLMGKRLAVIKLLLGGRHLLPILLTVNSGWASVQPIRVRVLDNAPEIQVRGADRPGALEWKVSCRHHTVQLLPLGSTLEPQKSVRQSSVVFHPRGERISVNRREYRGEIEVRSQGDACEVIDHLSVESYLRGVVNSEVSAQWSEESLAAQVIAARTYAYYQIEVAAGKKSRFDLDASVKDQVYEGSLKENLRSTQIVDRTQGLILSAHRGARPDPIKAFYHSTCGGETELPGKVWGGSYRGFKRKVACPFCRTSPAYSWSLELTSGDIVDAMQRGIGSSGSPSGWPKIPRDLFQAKNLLEVRPMSGFFNGRVGEVMTVWKGSATRFTLKLNASRFREWIGFSKLKSTWFQVQPRVLSDGGKDWVFQGRGNGHGVGMCQWGVKEMGAKGYRYASILHYYYPDAVLKKVW